jgi:hypothetical protein
MCPNNDNDKAARKQKALAELKQLVRDQRARLDPTILQQVAQKLAPQASAVTDAAPASEPYDRAAATRAIELFLAAHKDKADFKARLFSFIQKQSH